MEDAPTLKTILGQYLQAHYDSLMNTNQYEKSRIQIIAELNKDLSSQLQESYPQSLKAETDTKSCLLSLLSFLTHASVFNSPNHITVICQALLCMIIRIIEMSKPVNFAIFLISVIFVLCMSVMKGPGIESKQLIVSDSALTPISSGFLETQKLTTGLMQECDQNLKTKLQQIQECSVAMEQRIKDEAKSFREAFRGLLYLKDISLSPYNDVEAATGELEQKIKQMERENEEGKQRTSKIIADIQNVCTNLQHDIENMELVKGELNLSISNLQSTVNDKFNALALEPATDIKTMSSMEDELRNDISELAAKLK